MKFSYAVIAAVSLLGSGPSVADSRNPFEPVSAKKATSAAATLPAAKSETALIPSAAVAPMLPPMLPPPLPPKPPAPEVPRLNETPGKAKPKESPMRVTAASCQIKVKSSSVAAPAYGGIVTIALLGGARDCVSAVLVEENWLEAKELSGPSGIKLAVDTNDSNLPRQSSVVIANAGQSVTVTLVQEGRKSRER